MALTSRMWLSAGVFCFGLSTILAYHQDQVAANNVLAEKIELPKAVAIQDFNPAMHSNILSEVHLLGEAAMTETVTLNIGTEVAPNWLQVLPIYPVGATSRPFAEKYLTKGVRRPMPRDMHDTLAEADVRIRPLERQLMGLVVVESGVSIAEAALQEPLGDGLNGPVIAILGTELRAENLSNIVAEAFAKKGQPLLFDVPLIVPYLAGARGAITTTEDVNYELTRDLLEWGAILLLLIGTANAFSLPKRFLNARKPEVAEAFQQVEATSAFPSVFQGIRSQEDLIREEQEASERAASARRRTLSRINYPST